MVGTQEQINRVSGKRSEMALENALLDYEDVYSMTLVGKYRCRDCGLLFVTLEAHDKHARQVHRRGLLYPF